ncbi:MAG: TolC family protein [Bacteroidales bacterium]
MHRVYYFILLSLVLSTAIKAQTAEDYWTLERCLNHAREHNLTIQLQQLNVSRDEAMLRQQKAGMLPSLNAYAQHDYNWGRTVDRFTNDFANARILSQNFYLSSGVTVFNGFRLLNELKERQLQLQASEMDVQKTVDDIQLAVVTAYLQVIFNKELVEVNRSQVAITELQKEQTSRQVEAGALAQGALLNIQSQLAREELNLVNAENQLDMALLELKQILELPDNKPFDIHIPEIALPENVELKRSPQQIYEYAVDHRPEIEGAQLRVQSRQKALQAARGSAYPSLQLQASYGTGYSGASVELSDYAVHGYYPNGNITQSGDTVLAPDIQYKDRIIPFADQIQNNNNYSLGLSLTIPVFNGLQRRTAMQTSRIALEQSKIELRQQKNAVRKTIEQAWIDAEAALKRFYAAQKAQDASSLSFQYAQQKFDVGMMNATEFNEAKNNLTQAESDLLQAKYEYLFRSKVLDFYLDQPLTIEE